jgi:membrane-bound lytic murein transglycosylase D
MLKKNLVKTGFFCQGLLLWVPNAMSVKGEPLKTSVGLRSTKLSYSHREAADSLILPGAVDSASAFSSVQVSEKKVLSSPEVSLNKNATKFVKSYLKNEDETLGKVKERSKAYFKLIDTIFTKYGLPVELKYLAVIESDLKTTAVSRVGARGMWQLMPVTARELGLKITKKYDERTHVYKSTVAAARYLKDLYAEFGDWLLVMAAYNGGPGKVYHAIKRSGSRNFWVLQNYLPAESRCHVKRFIGTHYYFEGKGSITTLTKSEAIAYVKAMAEFKALCQDEEKETGKNSAGATAAVATSW